MPRTIVTVAKCPCGHRGCRTWMLNGIGNFYQGTGFPEAQARRIAKLINTDKFFPWKEEK